MAVVRGNHSSDTGFRALAVDCGTTRLKAVVVGGRGEISGVSAVDIALHKAGEGVYEWDAKALEADLAGCVRKVLSESRQKIGVVAVTGQGSAPVCLDVDGEPVFPVISHLDRRASEQRARVAREAGEVGYVASKIFPNLLWWKQNASRKFGKIQHVLDVREYVGYLLSGAFSFDSHSMDEARVEKLSALVKIDPAVFGEAHDYQRSIGRASESTESRFGVEDGVPIILAPGDSTCAAIGSGLGRNGVVCDVAGSTEVVATPIDDDSKVEVPGLYRIPHLAPGRSFLFTSPPLGFIYKWFVDTFYQQAEGAKYELVDKEVSVVEASEKNPYFIPSIRTSGYSYDIESSFVGVGMSHTRGNLARSVMESMAMRVRSTFEEMKAAGLRIERVRLSGGCASSDVWNQIRTDVYGMVTELNQTLETSSLGAAMVASVATGTYRDIVKAERSMVGVGKTYTPSPSAARTYDRVYKTYTGKLE